MIEQPESDPALIQSDDLQPSIGFAPPSSSLSASQRIREIKDDVPSYLHGLRTCPGPKPCGLCERAESFISEQVSWLLQRSDQDVETIANVWDALAEHVARDGDFPPDTSLADGVRHVVRALAAARQEVLDRRADVERLTEADARLRATKNGSEEELVPHLFNSRSPYEAGDDRDIWCKDCEYHRDHPIHDSMRLRATRQRTTNEQNDDDQAR